MPKDIEFILKDFVRHVINLEAEDDPAGTGFHREFRILREEQIQIKNENRFPTEDGKREENLRKNRYKDILPRDDRRVKLTEIEGEKGTDYINASFIDDVNGERGYIAAQGPMPHTVNDFWRMLLEYNTEIVFMACRLKEEGKPKCEKYWADNGQSATFGDITVHTESEEEIREHFFRRQLRVEKDGESHTLTQFHYVGWPDHNTPSSPHVLRTMVEDVRNFRRHLNIPMVVHCSAGCGRTGTICAIDFAWTLLDRGMITDEFSMFEIIKCMREQRMSMVQTPDQYEYTHMVMKALCNEWIASFAAHDYENITIGKPPVEDVEDVQEIYANAEFEKEDEKDGDYPGEHTVKVVTISEARKDTEKLVASSQPTSDSSLQMTKTKEAAVVEELKPRRSRSQKEVKKKPETKPEETSHKLQAGDTIPSTATPRPPTMVIASPSNVDAGEYVEVLTTATVSSSPSQQTPGSSDIRKKSSTSASGSEVQKVMSTTSSADESTDAQRKTSTSDSAACSNFDPHKTVITLGGGSSTQKIIKLGSVGVSHTKQQAPRPPIQTVVKPMAASGQQQQQQGRQTESAVNEVKSSEVVKMKAAVDDRKSDQHASSSERTPNTSAMSDEEAPDLPSRNYRPEEISSLPNSPTTTTAPSVNPLQLTTTTTTNAAPASTTTTSSTPQSPASPTSPTYPPASLNRDRPPQPIPVNHHHHQVPPLQGVKVVSTKTGQGLNPRPAAGEQAAVVVGQARSQGHPQSSSHHHHHQAKPPGMVSVMVGPQHQQQEVHQPRLVAARAVDGQSGAGHPTHPLVKPVMHNKGPAPRKGGQPMMLHQSAHPHSAGTASFKRKSFFRGFLSRAKSETGTRAPVVTPVVTHGGKIVYMTDRPQRVRGPKTMPPEWVATSKSHRGPFL